MKKKHTFLMILLFTFFTAGFASAQKGTLTGPKKFEGYTVYIGTNKDGEMVLISLKDDGSTFVGHGLCGKRKINLSGLTVWRGIATIVDDKGQRDHVILDKSASGVGLTVTSHKEVVDLFTSEAKSAEGKVSTLAPVTHSSSIFTQGEISGFYESKDSEKIKMKAEILQNGNRIYGTAKVMGEFVAVAGHLKTVPRLKSLKTVSMSEQKKLPINKYNQTIEGILLYRDNVQQTFKAFVASDNNSMVVHGVGDPITLVKKKGIEK